MANNSHFSRGSGVYTCECCKRQTRATGRGDNEHSQLCAQCYDLAGEENSLSDHGELYDVTGSRNALAFLAEKGVDVASLFSTVVEELARLDAAAAAPVAPALSVLKASFNTGRLYARHGQIIRAALVGNFVYFNDESRMIDGHFEVDPDFIKSAEQLQNTVMRAYDSNTYRSGKPLVLFTSVEDKPAEMILAIDTVEAMKREADAIDAGLERQLDKIVNDQASLRAKVQREEAGSPAISGDVLNDEPELGESLQAREAASEASDVLIAEAAIVNAATVHPVVLESAAISTLELIAKNAASALEWSRENPVKAFQIMANAPHWPGMEQASRLVESRKTAPASASTAIEINAERLGITVEQLLALTAWAIDRGRYWKRDLRAAWEVAGEGVRGYSPYLQQLRNKYRSHAWLEKVRL